MALLGQNLPACERESLTIVSGGRGLQSGERDGQPVLRFNPEAVQQHIKDVMRRNSEKVTFNGVEALIKAAEEGTPPLLRQGQLIFGTVSIAHHAGEEDKTGEKTFKGWLYNTFADIIMLLKTKQKRNFTYLHAAVYAGKYAGRHYVIENGGHDGGGTGTISVLPIEDAFELDASFFIVSPPKDSKNQSTRYLVLQRALASIGLKYSYHMSAVSCETFASAILGDIGGNGFEPIQLGVIRSHKKDHPDPDGQRVKHVEKYEKFHKDLCGQIRAVPHGTILSLEFYMKKPYSQRSTPWFQQMAQAYQSYIEAASRWETSCVLSLQLSMVRGDTKE